MTGQFLAADGTVAAPGITFSHDSDTGFYRTSSGQFVWVSNGTIQGVFGSGGLAISGTLAATTVAAGTLTLTNPLTAVNGGTPLFVNSASTTGSANAQALATGSTIPDGYVRATGSLVVFNPGYTNTGAMSLNDGLGAVDVYAQSLVGAAPMGGGEVVAGQMAMSVFDGTQYQLLNAAKAAGFGLLTNLQNKALIMKPLETQSAEIERWTYMHEKVGYKDTVVDKFVNVKNSQFAQPLFEFSGACAGCGETPYIKSITQLYGDRMIVANATGCSSIYGGSAPSTPYTITRMVRDRHGLTHCLKTMLNMATVCHLEPMHSEIVLL